MKLAKGMLKIAAKLAVAAILLVGFAAALWGPDRLLGWVTGAAGLETRQEQDVRFYTVRRQDLVIGVKERGALRATRNVKVGVPFGNRRGGQATIAWLRPEGDLVEKGELIIQFEKKGFEDAITKAEEQLADQEKQLEIARKNIEIEEAEGAATVSAGVTRLEETQESMRRYREEEAPKQLRSLIDAKRAARDKLEEARTKLADVQRDADEQLMGDESAQEKARASVEQARKALEAAENAYEDASLKQKKFRTYDYPEGMKQRAEIVKNAELELERKRVGAVNRVENQRTTVRRLEEQIERTKEQMAEQKDMLEQADVYAPVGGRLLYGDTDRSWPRPEDIKVGMQSWAGQFLMTIPDESMFEIDIYIAEDYRYRLTEGAQARVAIGAIPDMEIQGVVSEIENFAKTPPGGGPKKYKAAISIDKTDERLASGMGAEVEIIAETVPNALVVPIEAVYNIQGVTVCFVQDGDKLQRREVVTGKSSDHYVQIHEGLVEGERVALTRPAEVERRREKEEEEENGAVEEDTGSEEPAGPPEGMPPGQESGRGTRRGGPRT